MKWLTGRGVVAALGVGVAVGWGLGWRGFVPLLAFFISGSLLTQLTGGEGGRRTAAQVLANGGVAAIAALLGAWTAALGSLAAATADTWATELGSFARRPPRLITTGQAVPAGTSGGITVLGTAGGVVGAAVMGLLGATQNRVEPGPRQRESVRPRAAVAVVAAGEASRHRGAVGCDHRHAEEAGVDRLLDVAQHVAAQSREDSGRLRTEILGAGFVAWEPRAIEQEHTRTAAGQEQCARRAGRPGPDDDGVPAPGHRPRSHVPIAALAPPASVAAKLTPSLSSQRQPLTSCIGP